MAAYELQPQNGPVVISTRWKLELQPFSKRLALVTLEENEVNRNLGLGLPLFLSPGSGLCYSLYNQ